MPTFIDWKTDNYTFVGKAFDTAYADRLNKLSPVVGEVNARSIDYELTGSGGYGEAPAYDGDNLNEGSLHRGFKTIVTPGEFSLSIPVDYKKALIDKMGETRKVGTKLGDSAAMTVYLHVLRMFSNAFNTAGASMVGQNIGAAQYDRVRQIVFAVYRVMIAVALAASLVIYFFPEQVYGIFTDDPAVIRIGYEYIPIAILAFFSCAGRSGSNALINGSGNSRVNFITAVFDGIVLRLGLSVLFGIVLDMKYMGFWLGDALANFTPLWVGLLFYHSGAWKKKAV